MSKLSDAQAVLLAAAAARPDLSVLPAPAALKLRGAALERSLRALVRRGLVDRARLMITEAGLDALGVESEPVDGRAALTNPQRPADPHARAARPAGKLGEVLAAVAGSEGATLEELTDLSGWLPHTARAAISRLRQRGYDVRIATMGSRKAYRLVPAT